MASLGGSSGPAARPPFWRPIARHEAGGFLMRVSRRPSPLLAAALCLLALRPAAAASQAVYRFYDTARVAHFYLSDLAERDAAIAQGIRFEGTVMSLSSDPLPGRIPLFHLIFPPGPGHIYVSD